MMLCEDVAAGLESVGAAEPCQPAAIRSSHPNPQTCVRASSAFPKSHIPEITAVPPAFPELGRVLLQTFLLFRDFTFGVSRKTRCHHPLGVSLPAFTKKLWNIQEDSFRESPFSGLFFWRWSSAVNEIRTANVFLGRHHAECVLCCCFDLDLMWLRLYRIFFIIVFVLLLTWAFAPSEKCEGSLWMLVFCFQAPWGDLM